MMLKMYEVEAGLKVSQMPEYHEKNGRDSGALRCLRISLSPVRSLSLSGNGGKALHGLFLSIIARHDPERAGYLHKSDGLKPFSLTPLQEAKNRQGRVFLSENDIYSFEVHLLDEGLFATVMAALSSIGLNSEMLRLGCSTVRISRIETDDALNSPLVRFINLLEDAGMSHEIILEFLSPTAFRVKDNNCPFPLPKLVFQSLQNHWGAFSNIALAPELAEWMPLVRVSRYELKTELIRFYQFKTIGFTGKVAYELPAEMPLNIKQAFNCLADFAYYSGVGWKTTMGMGQTRRI